MPNATNLFSIVLAVNYDTLNLMLKFTVAMVGLLLLIWLLAIVTPKLAKLIDRLLGRVNIDKGSDSVSSDDENSYKVYDIYDGAKLTNESRNEKIDSSLNQSDEIKGKS